MEWRLSIRLGDGTANGEANSAIDAGYTDHKYRVATHLFVAGLWLKRDGSEFTLQWSMVMATHRQISFPATLPQLSSPSNALGELAAMSSSMSCRPRIGRDTAAGVIVICELFLEISPITEDPTAIPRDSMMDFGSRTPWLFPQRCNVVFMRKVYPEDIPDQTGNPLARRPTPRSTMIFTFLRFL